MSMSQYLCCLAVACIDITEALHNNNCITIPVCNVYIAGTLACAHIWSNNYYQKHA